MDMAIQWVQQLQLFFQHLALGQFAALLPGEPVGKLLLLLAVLLFLGYRIRTYQVRKERQIKYQINGLLSHLCTTYDQMEDVDWKNQKVQRYTFADGTIHTESHEISGVTDLIGPLHPEDAGKYTPEFIKGAIEKAMKTCSQIEFTAREKKNDEAFEWTSFLLQGIRSGATHERSCLLLKRNVDAARGEEMERRAQLSQDANAAREEAEKKSLFMDQVSQDSQQALETLLDTLKEIEIEKEPATQKQLLQNSSGQILYLEKVNKAIHDLSALESGALHPVQKQFNMEETLERWNDTYQKEAEKRKITFSYSTEPILYPHVIGDKKRLQVLLDHLLSSALLFTPTGEKIQCGVRQKLVRSHQVVMEWTLVAPAMQVPEEMAEKVFLPYAMVQAVSTSGNGGLGISIIYRLAELLGGKIQVIRSQNRGMRFVLELPYDFVSGMDVTAAQA